MPEPTGQPLDRTRLLAARYQAAQARPYLAAALYSLSVVPCDEIPTMAVDRHWRCYVCADFVARTPVDELAGVWVHEVAHLLRDHHGRATRLPPELRDDHHRVNVAQDCEINDDLLADGLRLPAGRVDPGRFGFRSGQLFEQYVPWLPASRCDPLDCGSGAHGQHRPWEREVSDECLGPAAVAAIRRHTAEAIRAHQRGRGWVPGGWQRFADEVLEPTLDWRQLLTGLLRASVAWAAGGVDYTYARPGRRGAALRGVVLPGLRRPLPRVAIVIDTSGSMSGADLAAVLGEVTGVLRAVGVGARRVTVLACDAAVATVQRVSQVDEITLSGGGGTDLRVGIDAALRGAERPDVIVVMTDGGTPWPPHSPAGCRVIATLVGPNPPDLPSWVESVRVS